MFPCDNFVLSTMCEYNCIKEIHIWKNSSLCSYKLFVAIQIVTFLGMELCLLRKCVSFVKVALIKSCSILVFLKNKLILSFILKLFRKIEFT